MLLLVLCLLRPRRAAAFVAITDEVGGGKLQQPPWLPSTLAVGDQLEIRETDVVINPK